MQPRYVVLRIYRFEADQPTGIAGVVEISPGGRQIPFASAQELWSILTQLLTARRGRKRSQNEGTS